MHDVRHVPRPPADGRGAILAWRRVAALAARQRGLVETRQLRAAGLSPTQIEDAVRGSRLHPLHRGVYAVGHVHLDAEAPLLAATLAVGPGSCLAGVPSLAFYGLLPPLRRHAPVLVLAPRHRRSRSGIEVRRASVDPRRDVRLRRGIPVLRFEAAVADAAGALTVPVLHAVVNEAAVRGWLRPRAAAETALLVRGRPGAPALRKALGALDPSRGRTRRELERRFARFCRRHDLPPCVRGGLVDIGDGVQLELREVDVWFPVERVVVELDGLAFHERGGAPVRDRRRDRRLLAAGILTVRVTWTDLDDHEDELAADLHRVLRNARHAHRP
ncbi:MAG: hypothetical protein JWM31_3040 [Solirubrobacterales bacterium]|nr:hypothetical protein [Solirubrobacterales bacterium]